MSVLSQATNNDDDSATAADFRAVAEVLSRESQAGGLDSVQHRIVSFLFLFFPFFNFFTSGLTKSPFCWGCFSLSFYISPAPS
jgi:hypothetical protein